MKIIINSRKYKMKTQFEMLDLGMPDEFETKEEVLEALKTLDEIVAEYTKEPDEPFGDAEMIEDPDKKGNMIPSHYLEGRKKLAKKPIPF